jgi:chromosome segregation ATPase
LSENSKLPKLVATLREELMTAQLSSEERLKTLELKESEIESLKQELERQSLKEDKLQTDFKSSKKKLEETLGNMHLNKKIYEKQLTDLKERITSEASSSAKKLAGMEAELENTRVQLKIGNEEVATLKESYSINKSKYESMTKNLKIELRGLKKFKESVEENRNKNSLDISELSKQAISLKAKLKVAQTQNKQMTAVRSLNDQLTKDKSSRDELISSLNIKLGIAQRALNRSVKFEISEDSKILPETTSFFTTIDKRLRTKHRKLKEINSRIEYRIECTEKRLKELRSRNSTGQELS